MTIKQIIDYNNPAEFTYDSNKMIVDGSGARLLPQPLAGNIVQDYTNDTGFTYDPALIGFSAGTASQLNQRNPGASWGANYNSNINGNWGDSPLLPTNTFGTPVITGNKLDLIGNSVTYDMKGSINAAIGTLRWKYTPNYTGNPGSNQQFFFMSNAGLGTANRMFFQHDTASAFRWTVHTSTGSLAINNGPFGTKVLTAGVEYEMELNYDFVNGQTQLFIDGVQQGGTNTAVISRSNDLLSIEDFRVGGSAGANYLMNDLLTFTSVQHTAPYVPGYTVADNEYSEALLVCPNDVPTSNLLELTSFIANFVGFPRFIVKGSYWDGASWVVSDNSYAQGSAYADIVANIASLDVSGDTFLAVSIVFPTAVTQTFIDSHTIGRNVAGLFYPEALIYSNSAINMNVLSNLEEISTILGADSILNIVRIGSTNYWWDGLAWVLSDSTSANANTIPEILAHAGTLPISTGASVTIAQVLISNDGSTTPQMEQLTVTFTFGIVDGCEPVKCVVYGCILDNSGNGIGGAKITVDGSDYFYTEAVLAPGNDKPALIARSSEAFSNAEGEFGIEVVETVTDSTTVDITVEYKQKGKTIKNKYTGLTIPAVTAVPLGNLVNP